MTELRKLQLVELDLLREVDRICRKYGLKYYLSAGTLLGAVRHKGFIPWDDDIDLKMPIDDYKKFCEICEKELDKEKYFLQNMDTDPYYLYIFAKFRRQGTLYIRKGQEHMKYHHGICIDIFPMYPYPQIRWIRNLFTRIIAICKTIMWAPIGAVSENRVLPKMFYKLLSMIPKKIPRKIIEFLLSRCSGESTVNPGAPSFGKKKRNFDVETIQNLIIRETVELDFEGMKCLAPKNYDYWLYWIYGDYMQLPPESERFGHHHATIIDLGDAIDNIVIKEAGNA